MKLGLEQELVINVTLQLASVNETVTVTARGTVVESTVVGLRERIEPTTIENIPLNGRQFLDLVQLVPGTAAKPPDNQDGSDATVLGGRSITNAFLIDGMQNTDNLTGNFKEFFIPDAIQEFNVNVAGFLPEYGLASGAVINIITKSGTNQLTGRAFLFARNDSLDSSNVQGQAVPALQRYDVGGTVAGALVKDRTWFFDAIENLHEKRGINLDLSQVPDIIKSGFATPSTGGVEPFDAKPITRRFTNFGKVNHRISASHQLFLSGNVNHNTLDKFVRPSGGGAFISPPAGSISMPSTASDIFETIFSVNGRETSFFANSHGLIESSFRYLHGNNEENTQKGGGSADEISLLTFGANGRFWNTNYPLVGAQKTLDKRFEWGEDLSYFAGKHSPKFGVRVNHLSLSGFFRAPTLNIIGNTALIDRYKELGMDLSSQQSPYVLAGDPNYDIKDTVYSVYAQDTWQVASNFSINGGIRYDYETLFSSAQTNFAPRFGLTFDPWKNGKTVFRASGGLFYDAELLNPALRIADLGGMTFGRFSFQSIPRGASFWNNPAINAFGPLQASGTRFLANPNFFSYILPAGTTASSGNISVTGKGQPYIIYDLLGIPVPDPRTPPVLDINSIPTLTNGKLTAQQALDVLNNFFPSRFPQFFYVAPSLAGQTIRQGLLAFKSGTENPLVDTIQTIQEPFKTPYVASLNFGVERELFGEISIDGQYFFRRGRDLLARRVINLRDTPISNTCIGNTVDGQPCNSQLVPIGFSNVNAATIALRKRQSHRYSFLLSYTYTHAIDNFGTLNTRGPANFNLNNEPEIEVGRSLTTPLHVVAFSGNYTAPAAIDIAGVVHASSGRPFNAAGLPQDSDGDGNFDDRLWQSTSKGQFTTDKILTVDLRLAKSFGPRTGRITFMGEFFNLFNRANPLTVNRTFGPTIGQTIQPTPGREMQLGVRVDF